MPFLCSFVKRCFPIDVCCAKVGTARDQQLDNISVAFLGCPMQRCSSPVVFVVDISPMIQKEYRSLQMAL
eukprot:m.130665 g.130665  ORF g.130665 m.130665 type:complete len:70 (-) comp9792_c0_seq2:352-561(-)